MIRLAVHPVFRVAALLVILGAFIALVQEGLGLKERIFYVVYDTYIKLKPRPATDQIVFIDIDDQSLARIGQWPWPRTVVADLVTSLKDSGAKVIVFDGVLAESDRTSPENFSKFIKDDEISVEARETLLSRKSHDEILADAIRNAGNFVAGFSYGSNPEPPQIKRNILIKKDHENFFLEQKGKGSVYFTKTAQFLPVLQDAAAGNGSFMASAESDSVIRQTGLIFHDGKKIYPSLILEAFRLYLQSKDLPKIVAVPGYQNYKIDQPFHLNIGSASIPLSPEGKMWVYFREIDHAKESIPAYRFLNLLPEQEKQDVTGKIVFIGSSAEGLMDLRATPMGMQPGVMVHINALEQILQNTYLIRPYAANVLEIGACVAASVILLLLSFFINPVWLAGICAVMVAGAFTASWHLFSAYNALFDPVTPSIGVMVVFTAASLLSFLKNEMERKQVRQAFGLYISPDFMKELTRDPGKLRLGGEIRDLTVMFTDIRKFTTISEGLTPEELIQLMNDFLTPMSDLVMQTRGTIDKYMGDAMMAFWNAPLDDVQHARHACIAALGMQKALEPINEGLRKKSKSVLLQTGIGINTGPCAVGNMGSRQRFAYSALGDAVNLASRLEGQTKTYGVGILLSEATQKQVPDLAMLEMDMIRVKGKSEAVRLYTLVGDQQEAERDQFRKLKERHDKMLAAYRGRNFEETLVMAQEMARENTYNLQAFYDLYKDRAQGFIKNPPPENWDAVYEAESK